MSNSSDYRSPATTHSTYAKDDPTSTTYNKDQLPTDHTSKDQHHHHHHHHQQQQHGGSGSGSGSHDHHHPHATDPSHGATGNDRVIKTGEYQTGLERGGVNSYSNSASAVPVVGTSYQDRVSGVNNNANVVNAPTPGYSTGGVIQPTQPGYNNTDGLVVDSSVGGAFGSGVVLGGQCECVRNGGTCQHGEGKCVCRGCTTRATTVNPGVNIGISTMQYTAPASTTGIGGGVADPGVGIAGMIHPSNTTGTMVNPTDSNCECVKSGGSCSCPSGACTCSNCAAKRRSYQQTSVASTTSTTNTMGTGTTNTMGTTNANRHNIDSGHASNILGGSEYINSSSNPNSSYHYSSNSTSTPAVDPTSPLTDNSNIKPRV